MPRITAAREQAVRQRIVDAAIAVFGELGYRRATIQDVVVASGLSVGAVYTHFTSKEELFLIACRYEADRQKADLRARLEQMEFVGDRLRAAADWAIDSALVTGDVRNVLLRGWAEAAGSPELRELLHDRRTEMVTFAQVILAEAVARDELPRWIDVDGVANAFVTLIDGLILRGSETGRVEPEEARREVAALLQLLLAAPRRLPPGAALPFEDW